MVMSRTELITASHVRIRVGEVVHVVPAAPSFRVGLLHLLWGGCRQTQTGVMTAVRSDSVRSVIAPYSPYPCWRALLQARFQLQDVSALRLYATLLGYFQGWQQCCHQGICCKWCMQLKRQVHANE